MIQELWWNLVNCLFWVNGAESRGWIKIVCSYTLIRKSPSWCVFTQAWGYIVITSYLGVFKFACVISQGFGLLRNKLYYNCMSYILTLHIKKLCKIKVTLDLLSGKGSVNRARRRIAYCHWIVWHLLLSTVKPVSWPTVRYLEVCSSCAHWHYFFSGTPPQKLGNVSKFSIEPMETHSQTVTAMSSASSSLVYLHGELLNLILCTLY